MVTFPNNMQLSLAWAVVALRRDCGHWHGGHKRNKIS